MKFRLGVAPTVFTLLLLLVACADSPTVPETVSFEGEWQMERVDDMPLPADVYVGQYHTDVWRESSLTIRDGEYTWLASAESWREGELIHSQVIRIVGTYTIEDNSAVFHEAFEGENGNNAGTEEFTGEIDGAALITWHGGVPAEWRRQ